MPLSASICKWGEQGGLHAMQAEPVVQSSCERPLEPPGSLSQPSAQSQAPPPPAEPLAAHAPPDPYALRPPTRPKRSHVRQGGDSGHAGEQGWPRAKVAWPGSPSAGPAGRHRRPRRLQSARWRGSSTARGPRAQDPRPRRRPACRRACRLKPAPICPAVQMFTKTGQASRVSLGKEIAIGLTMGAALGFWWQT